MQSTGRNIHKNSKELNTIFKKTNIQDYPEDDFLNELENIKKELKKRARSITSRLLKSNQEEKLVDFLKLDLLSDRMLASLQETAQENGMTTVSAYILNEQNKKLLKKESSKSTFRI